MASPVVGNPNEELVYAPAIPMLAGHLYPNKLEIIREYIQNASDALDMFSRVAEHIEDTAVPQIKISIHGKSLVIFDNGIGMDEEEIHKLKRIAYSEKRGHEHAGHKGIGRLAGIAVADRLVISSTRYGDPQLYKFEFRAKDLQTELDAKKQKGVTELASVVINRHTSITSIDTDEHDHYTMVELHGIDPRHPDLLDAARLREYIAEMGPVGFAPDFKYAELINKKLHAHVRDYSPKTVWLTTGPDARSQVYKPYDDAMFASKTASLAEPEFIEIEDPEDSSRLLAYCWWSVMGREMLGKVRPAGNKFTVSGKTSEEKQRLAGLAYKLFGLSVGGRTLPLTTLWPKDFTRALWFTGEIHIVDKDIQPTTDRSDFIDNAARDRLYRIARDKIAKKLNARAQEISDSRQRFDVASSYEKRFQEMRVELDNGGIDRTALRAVKEELRHAKDDLGRRCKDKEIDTYVRQVAQQCRGLDKRLEDATGKESKSDEISDLARELKLTTQARAVFRVIMDTIDKHFDHDRKTYYALSGEIRDALRKKIRT